MDCDYDDEGTNSKHDTDEKDGESDEGAPPQSTFHFTGCTFNF